jgi:hypothetical protein
VLQLEILPDYRINEVSPTKRILGRFQNKAEAIEILDRLADVIRAAKTVGVLEKALAEWRVK